MSLQKAATGLPCLLWAWTYFDYIAIKFNWLKNIHTINNNNNNKSLLLIIIILLHKNIKRRCKIRVEFLKKYIIIILFYSTRGRWFGACCIPKCMLKATQTKSTCIICACGAAFTINQAALTDWKHQIMRLIKQPNLTYSKTKNSNTGWGQCRCESFSHQSIQMQYIWTSQLKISNSL